MDAKPHLTSAQGDGRRSRIQALDFLPVALFVGCYAAAEYYWRVPPWVAGVYVSASAVTVVAYAIDKGQARRSGRRIPEKILNLLAFLGGWPGAIVAQQTMRHKTIKASFRRHFWVAAVANIVLFLLLASPIISSVLR